MIKQSLLVLLISIFASLQLEAKPIEENDTIILSKTLLKFIPKGYALLDTAIGNLNLDRFQDLILVLKNKKENSDKYESEYKRPFLILLGHANNTYTLSKRNDNAVYGNEGGGVFGEAFTGVIIKNGYFSIEQGIQGGQHWQQVTTFKFDKSKGNWFLYKDHYISYKFNESNDPNAEALILDIDKLETTKEFGVIPFDKFNINNEKKQ